MAIYGSDQADEWDEQIYESKPFFGVNRDVLKGTTKREKVSSPNGFEAIVTIKK